MRKRRRDANEDQPDQYDQYSTDLRVGACWHPATTAHHHCLVCSSHCGSDEHDGPTWSTSQNGSISASASPPPPAAASPAATSSPYLLHTFIPGWSGHSHRLGAITIGLVCWLAKQLVTFSSRSLSLLFFALFLCSPSPYLPQQHFLRQLTSSVVHSSSLNLRSISSSSQSILLYSSYYCILFTSATSGSPFVAKAESIQGLSLNSFIPHFEPLYYDRHQLLHQYTRLKRSMAEKKSSKVEQATETQHKTERQRKRTRRRTSGSVDDGDSDISSGTNSRDDLVILAKKNPIVDTTKPPHPPHASNMSSGDDDDEHGVEGNGNNSLNSTITITSTTAFFRHNCPMPNHEHHTEDSTEKVMLNHRSGDHGHNRTATTRTLSTTSDQAKHSNKPSTSTTSDSWLLQYDSDTHPDETDTDASIDIVDEHDGQVDEDSDDNEHSHSNVIFDSPKEQHIRVTFTAHNRLFRLKLQLNSEHVFAQDPVFESTGNKDFRYDTSNVVRGHLEDDEQAIFDGIITRDGLLDGHLTTRHDEFYIEPADRHYHGHDHEHDFHSVIYSTSVVNFPNATHGSASPYFGSKYLPLMNVPFRGYFDHWLDGLMDEQSDLFNNIEQVLHLNGEHQRKRRRPKRSEPSDSSASSEIVDLNTTDHPSLWSSYVRTNQTFNGSNSDVDFEIHYANNKMSYSSSSVSSSSVSSSSSSSTSTSRIPSKAEHFRKVASKNGITGGVVNIGASSSGGTVVRNVVHTADGHGGRYWRDMDSLHYTESEPYGIKAVHPRTHWIDDQRHHDRHVVVDPKKTTCMLYLQADHLFFEKMGSEEACIESMTRHVQKVNNIYKNTDFDQDGRPDNISFLIKRIKVHTLEALKDPEYRYPSTYGVEKFLELFSEEDYDAFCLAYMFTYRDFEGGTLGLAWTGDLKNAGGVCEKNGHYRGSLKSLNTGIVTLLNYGKHVPPIVSHVTLAHEIGHNFGSPHDPEDDHACTPGGENGNYIMFARATSGDKRNNNKFSPCSLRSINAVLNTKAKSLKGCFQEPQDAICGNEVVEEGEECDCGWEEDCKEPCCFPMRANPPADEPPCRLRPNVICSPSMGPCCTQDCKLKVGNKCRDDNGCRTASYCNGHGPTCPPSTNKANKTICNEEYVCYMGECTGSICMAYGLESCQCKQGPNDPPTKLCELCCRMPSDDSTCKSSFEWNTTPYDVPDLFSKPGTPCENYNGYCDVNQRCREVDPSSPLATLRRLLLSNESMASLKRWFNEQWFYVAVLIMISVLILLMAYKVFNSRRSLRLTKTDIMEVALEAVAKHQQEQAQQQAQQQQQQSSQSSATASTSNGSDSMSQVSSSCGVSQSNKTGSSSANSTSSPTSNTTVNTSSSVSTMSTATSSTSSSSSMSLSSTKTTTTSALIATPTSSGSVGHNHATSNNPSANSSTNASLQAKNSIDSQHSLLDHNSANSYGFNGTNSANPMESSYTGTMSSYIPPTNNQTSNNSMQPKVSSSNYAPAVDSSLYGTMKNGHQSYYQSKHSNASSNAVVAAQQASLMADTTNSLYNHPFSPQQGGSLYGYSRGQSNGHHHHHHHSIPSLYQPSMIYQQQQTVVAASAPMGAQQSFYDTSALAIVANQHHQPTYGTTTNQAYHHLTAEQTYGQTYYYPANGGRQLSYPAQASTYYQSSLYDYIPFPRPVNPNSATTKPPPLPSMATHPAQIQHQHPTPSSTSTHKNRSMDMANTLDTRRLYSSSLEVPGYKDNNSAYYTDSAVGQSTSGDKNGHHHHHYYYQQLYGNTAANSSSNASSSKFAQHYPTMHRGSTGSSAASLHHHNHLTPGSGTSASSQASRHYQHFYPHQLHASTSAAVSASHHTQGSSGSHSRQHHSSHPQLLNTTSLSVPRASGSGSGATAGATALEPTYGTTSHHTTSGPPSRRSQHQSQIYEPLATLPMTSMGHYGYSQMDHSGHHPNNSIYYSSRSEVFAQHHESLPPMGTLGSSGTGGLHHSNSFHGHLDDFDLINPINSDAASDSNVGMSTGHKHGKSHGSSGWV